MQIPLELADATLHCREGAAILFIENMYQILTNRPYKYICYAQIKLILKRAFIVIERIQKAAPSFDIDLTDWSYQSRLPYHARSTASKTIKNNIRDTELMTDPNLKYTASKVENIIANHVDHRKAERDENPKRFNVKKTLAERCIQKPVPDVRKCSTDTYDYYSANQDGCLYN